MRALLPLALALSLALLGPACTGQPPAAEGPPGQVAELAFAACMRDLGYPWPDPVYVAGTWDTHIAEEIDYDSDAFREDQAACEQVRGEAGGSQPAGGEDEFNQHALEKALEFAACMREQGIEFPDPVVEGDGFSGPAGPLDGDQAAFDAAAEVCQDR